MLGAVGGVFFSSPQPPKSLAKAVIATPVSLEIPAIGVNATVEFVGLDKYGNMDIPKNVYHVGWYSLGVKPGENGQAVMAGHLNTPELTPSVFWNLKNLKPGDVIIVQNENGREVNFAVREVRSVDTAEFPVQEIFGPSSKPQLNLITCDGYFDRKEGTYNRRIVVYSDLR